MTSNGGGELVQTSGGCPIYDYLSADILIALIHSFSHLPDLAALTKPLLPSIPLLPDLPKYRPSRRLVRT